MARCHVACERNELCMCIRAHGLGSENGKMMHCLDVLYGDVFLEMSMR